MRYYIIAGEASGDLHGSNLMKGLLRHDPSAEIRFWGGDLMAAVGGTMVRNYKDNAVMGFVEVLGRLGSILRNLAFCKQDILEFRPDAVIFIDYPGFNLKIAKFAHGQGFKTFYYIPPKVWARGKSRIKQLKRYIDKVFIIFPFEIEFFRKHGVDFEYFGNPLCDSIAAAPSLHRSRAEFLAAHGLADDGREHIALLAGSRKMEVDYLLPRMVKTIEVLREQGDCPYRFILAAAPSIDLSYYEKFIAGSSIEIVSGDTYGVLHHSRAAIISSGTASLEAAIIGTPQVVCYGMNPLTFAIAKRIVKLDTVSLANMILGKHIFRELLQDDCTPENIAAEVRKLAAEGEYRQTMLDDYRAMLRKLGEKDCAERCAAYIDEYMQSGEQNSPIRSRDGRTKMYKYSGAGNTFVIAHLPEAGAEIPTQEIIRLCSRDGGFGTDGFIILEPSEKCDFRMRFYNNDGSGGMMCGNGGRCIVDLAHRVGIKPSGPDGSFIFEAPDGVHKGKILSINSLQSGPSSADTDCCHAEEHDLQPDVASFSIVEISMRDVSDVEEHRLTDSDGHEFTAFRMNTGTDHLVIFRDSLEGLDIVSEGRRWRYDERFAPRGVNVNFVSRYEPACATAPRLRMRTYEKGVEAETLACGTGVIAAALASHIKNSRTDDSSARSSIIYMGANEFRVSFRPTPSGFTDIRLQGPVELV